MKLKAVKTEKKNPEEIKAVKSRRGRTSRNKGANYERTISKKFKAHFGVDLVRTPQSGGFAKNAEKADDYRGDVVSADKTKELEIHIECKNHKSWSLPSWIKQAQEDCPTGKKPVVITHKHGTSEDYITLKLEDFFDLIDPTKIFKEVK